MPNEASSAGGGVSLVDCPDVFFALNEVSSNRAGLGAPGSDPKGAGIYLIAPPGSLTLIVKNTISNNIFEQIDSGLRRQGGGIYANVQAGAVLGLCQNDIHDNVAIKGSGVYLTLGAGPFDVPPLAHVEENEIHHNNAWLPFTAGIPLVAGNGYRGGGVYVDTPDSDHHLIDIFNNRIHNNNIDIDVASGYDPGSFPTRVGGGVYTNVPVADPDDLLTRINFIGHFINANTAGTAGGGVFMGVFDWPAGALGEAEGTFYNNTVTHNQLTDPAGLGVGVYLPNNIDLPAVLGAALDASSNIVFHNGPPPPDQDWYAETPLDPQTLPFRYSQMPNPSPPTSPENLFGPDCSTSSPLIFGANAPHLSTHDSPCVDDGDPNLTPADLVIEDDIDGEPRELDILTVTGSDILDRGGDEYTVLFRRGDVNGDGIVNIADVVNLLSWLFVPGTPPPQNCEDSQDVNDDGTIDLADAVYLLNALFVPGSPPVPPPHAVCRLDPTRDDITPCVDPASNPCL